jgi:hypothetical protein
MTSTKRLWVHAAMLAAVLVIPAVLLSAERRAARNSREAAPAADVVEMFAAMRANDIDVKLIPKDETESRVIIKNNTQKPLTVKLPDAFAGVPVLAQRQGGLGGGGGNRGGGGGNTGGNQGVGGGMGGGMMGGGGGGMGMGMMNVPADKVRQFKVATVCLEHGKPEPRAHIPYEIVPIEEFTTSEEIKELLTAFGKQSLSQRATQVAAWHLANGLTWEQLANKRIEHINGTSEPWFSPQEIQAGMQISNVAERQVAQNAARSSGQTPSQNRSSQSEP